MAALVRVHDWSGAPIGPIDRWSATLRTAVDLILASGFPMVLLWGRDLVQIYNDGYRELMGVKHPTGLGQPTRDCWPEVWHINAPIYDEVLAGKTLVFEDTLYPITRSGVLEDAWFTLSYSPLRTETGEVGGLLVTVFETTARHIADAARRSSQHALHAQEERLHLALDAADLGTWDLDLTTDRSAVRSVRHDRMFGYVEPQAEWGQRIAERHVVAEDVPIFRAAFDDAARTGELKCEVRVRWPDGSVHWIAPRGRVYYDESGKPIRMTGVVADVTDRRRSDEWQRLIVQIARDYAVFTTDPDGRITEWLPGAAAVFGWSAAEALGQPNALLFTPEDRAADVPSVELETARREGRVPDVRWHARPDGSRVFIEGSTTALYDDAGHLQGFLKIGQDITERKLLLDALQEADQRKDEFLAMLAHELRSPLSPLVNAHRVLEHDSRLGEHSRRMIQMAIRQTRQLQRLVDDLLEVSRVNEGKIELRLESLMLSTVVYQAVEGIRPMVDQRHHDLSVELPSRPVYVTADPVRLAQILENLLTNACKYTPDGGRIRVVAIERDHDVEISVVDNGIGIDPANVAGLFELFHQIDASLDRAHGGLGIGLAMVKRLAELHGGTVQCDSQGLGKGATFTVKLPRALPPT